uniref:Junctional adhesion molecule 2 n=1 Tax=Leptobrachium leishanense TaxID=445787 RepID=A0A8C5MMT0_9ANUR
MSPSACFSLFLGYFVALYCKGVFGVTVTSENLNVRVMEFGEVILYCKYKLEKEQPVRLEWKKLWADGDISFVYVDNFLTDEFRTRAEMIGSSIRIKRVTRSDSGKYRCEVSAPKDDKSFQEIIIELNVLAVISYLNSPSSTSIGSSRDRGWGLPTSGRLKTLPAALVEVAPSVPVCDIPSSAISGSAVELKCQETEGFPASEYKWFKNGVPLENQGQNPKSANATYTLNKSSGSLQFNTVAKTDTGEYHCEAHNSIGKAQKCAAKKMQVDDLNIAGIAAAAVIAALVILLCGFGIFYAHRRGVCSRRKPADKDSAQADFKHTKSFVI